MPAITNQLVSNPDQLRLNASSLGAVANTAGLTVSGKPSQDILQNAAMAEIFNFV